LTKGLRRKKTIFRQSQRSDTRKKGREEVYGERKKKELKKNLMIFPAGEKIPTSREEQETKF